MPRRGLSRLLQAPLKRRSKLPDELAKRVWLDLPHRSHDTCDVCGAATVPVSVELQHAVGAAATLFTAKSSLSYLSTVRAIRASMSLFFDISAETKRATPPAALIWGTTSLPRSIP